MRDIGIVGAFFVLWISLGYIGAGWWAAYFYRAYPRVESAYTSRTEAFFLIIAGLATFMIAGTQTCIRGKMRSYGWMRPL